MQHSTKIEHFFYYTIHQHARMDHTETAACACYDTPAHAVRCWSVTRWWRTTLGGGKETEMSCGWWRLSMYRDGQDEW